MLYIYTTSPLSCSLVLLVCLLELTYTIASFVGQGCKKVMKSQTTKRPITLQTDTLNVTSFSSKYDIDCNYHVGSVTYG